MRGSCRRRRLMRCDCEEYYHLIRHAARAIGDGVNSLGEFTASNASRFPSRGRLNNDTANSVRCWRCSCVIKATQCRALCTPRPSRAASRRTEPLLLYFIFNFLGISQGLLSLYVISVFTVNIRNFQIDLIRFLEFFKFSIAPSDLILFITKRCSDLS